jgi:hypothetical protein
MAAGATGWLDNLPAIVGVVERMSTGLLCTQIGLQRHGRLLLAAADALAG